MAMNQHDMELNAEQRERLSELSQKTGRSWSELLDDALHTLSIHESGAGERLRSLLNDLGRNASLVPERDLDEAIDEAAQLVRHRKS